MVPDLLRASIPPRKDPHDWNSWDHYQTIHERRLNEHPFVISFQDTLDFKISEDWTSITLEGTVLCHKDIFLHVAKEFDARFFGNTLRVRCHTYVYIGWLQGEHLLLKYHNMHRTDDDYHHRIYDPASGVELHHEVLQRYQFPTFTEVLDELQIMAQDL